jgi:hypothetical protein
LPRYERSLVQISCTTNFPHQREPVVPTADFRETWRTSGEFRATVPVPTDKTAILMSREWAYRVTPQLPFCRSYMHRSHLLRGGRL